MLRERRARSSCSRSFTPAESKSSRGSRARRPSCAASKTSSSARISSHAGVSTSAGTRSLGLPRPRRIRFAASSESRPSATATASGASQGTGVMASGLDAASTAPMRVPTSMSLTASERVDCWVDWMRPVTFANPWRPARPGCPSSGRGRCATSAAVTAVFSSTARRSNESWPSTASNSASDTTPTAVGVQPMAATTAVASVSWSGNEVIPNHNPIRG